VRAGKVGRVESMAGGSVVLAPVDVRAPASVVARLIVAGKADRVRVAGGSLTAEEAIQLIWGPALHLPEGAAEAGGGESGVGGGEGKRQDEESDKDEEDEEDTDTDEEDVREDEDDALPRKGQVSSPAKAAATLPVAVPWQSVRADWSKTVPIPVDPSAVTQAWSHPVGRFLARIGRIRVAPQELH
jgi:hypothetical protein